LVVHRGRERAEMQERQRTKNAAGREAEPAKTVREERQAQQWADACPYRLADAEQGEGVDALVARLRGKVRPHGRLKECTAQPAQKGCPQRTGQRLTETEEQKTRHAQGAASGDQRFIATMVRQDAPNHAKPLLAECAES